MPIRQGGQFAMKRSSLVREKDFLKTTLLCLFMPTRLKLFFAKSMPTIVIFIMTSPTIKYLFNTFTLVHFDADCVGGVRLIHYVDMEHQRVGK